MESSQYPWSEWAWSDSDKQWYRYRHNHQAPEGLEYEWDQGQNTAEPRITTDAVDFLADRIARLRYSSDGISQAEVLAAGEYQYSNSPQHSKPPKPSSHAHHKLSKAASAPKQAREKGYKASSKPRPREEEQRSQELLSGDGAEYNLNQASYDQDHPSVAYARPITEDLSVKGKGKGRIIDAEALDNDVDEARDLRQLSDTGERTVTAGLRFEDEKGSDKSGDVSDQEQPYAMDESRRTYAPPSRGETSAAGSSRPYAFFTPEEATPASPSAIEYESVMGTRSGETMVLDPRYRVEHSSKFAPGMVFKILWPEPQGNNQTPSISDKQVMNDGYGGSIHVGFRRFIVVANDAGHCHCVPVLTYGGRACKKRGVKPEKHGIVHDVTKTGKPLDKEPKLGFSPVRVQMNVDGETLRRESRVNYSKLHPVEHNYKVFFIGTVIEEDLDAVRFAVNYCWENKKHATRR